jgi:hypothetical protein
MTHFSPNSVAGCISNVECSVGGNLELRRTIVTTGPRGVIGTDVVLLTHASGSSERLPQEPIRLVSRNVLPSKKIAVS